MKYRDVFCGVMAGCLAFACAGRGAPPEVLSPPAPERPQPSAREVVVPPADRPPAPRTLVDVEKDLGLIPGMLRAQSQSRLFHLDVGDAVFVQVGSHPQFSQEALVTPDGRMSLPKLGSARVQGMALPQVEEEVVTLCRNIGLKNPVVSVSLKTPAKRYVTIIGMRTGAGTTASMRYEIQGSGTLLETLAGAGWTSAVSRTRQALLVRDGRQALLDLADIGDRQSVEMNIDLHANDILMFSEQPPYTLRGQLNAAGITPVPDRGWVTLEEALVAAAGIKSDADVENVQIVRTSGQVERVNLNRYLYGQQDARIRIHSGDELYVPLSRDVGVYVFGMVEQPGLHRRPQRISLSQAIAMAGPTKFGAVTSDIKVIRGYPASPKVESVNFDALSDGNTAHDVDLHDGDVVYIPESTFSDVTDTLGRVFGPLSGTMGAAVQATTLRKLTETK